MTQPRSHSYRLPTRTLNLLGPKNQRFFTPLGYLPTVIFLSPIFLTLFIGGSAIATSRFLCLPAEVSESRDPISLVNADFPRRFGTSCYRDSCPISSGSPIPRPEVPRCRLLDLLPFVGSLLTRLTSELVNLWGPMYRGHYFLRPLWSMPCTWSPRRRLLHSRVYSGQLIQSAPRNADMADIQVELWSLKFSLATSSRRFSSSTKRSPLCHLFPV